MREAALVDAASTAEEAAAEAGPVEVGAAEPTEADGAAEAEMTGVTAGEAAAVIQGLAAEEVDESLPLPCSLALYSGQSFFSSRCDASCFATLKTLSVAIAVLPARPPTPGTCAVTSNIFLSVVREVKYSLIPVPRQSSPSSSGLSILRSFQSQCNHQRRG